MVGHKRDGMERVGFNQRAGEDLAHVIVAALAGRFVEFHLQRGVEQHGFALHLIDIVLQFVDFVGPVFGHDKQRFGGHFLDVFDPLFIEPGRNVLHRVETKTVALGLLHHPARPVFYLFRHGVIAEIDVFAHQIIEIPHLIIDLIVPAFAGVIIDDLKDAVLVGVFDMVDTAEAFVVPDKLGILPGANGEGVAGPGFAFDDLIVNLGAILLVHTLHADWLFLIRAHFVVHHHVQQHRDLIAF
ncbi:hypothetical protein D3C72_1205360 [compost metagenome]